MTLSVTLGGRSYGRIYPEATYQPWVRSPAFLAAFRAVQGHTLVDVYRAWDLWLLAGQAGKLAPGDFLEVGTWRGGSGVLLALAAQHHHVKAHTWLCDTFRGIVKAGPNDNHWKDGDLGGADDAGTPMEVSCRVVQTLVAKLDVGATVLEGVFPDETSHWLTNRQLRLVHVDVDVYQSAADVLTWVWPRLVRGGMVVYDDYGFEECQGIAAHVEEQSGRPDRLVCTNLNGHALIVKL